MAKLPRHPNRPVPKPVATEVEAVGPDRPLYRIYRAGGRHATTWSRFRSFGPVRNGRFDHHPLPRADHADRGVLYAALDVKTAIAEAFGDERTIDRFRDEPYVARFRLSRELEALDLRSDWPKRAGASQGLASGPRPVSQAWSRAIWSDLAGIGGLVYPSSMHGGGTNVALYERAKAAMPTSPERNLPLSLPGFEADLIRIATELGFAIL